MAKTTSIAQCKHPNSRKTKVLQKQIKKSALKEKKKLQGSIKYNLIGEKCLWFQENLPDNVSCLSSSQMEEIIKKYLSRFNEELEQINIKHSVGVRKNRQHASREDIIKLTLKRELEEYKTCGLVPDLMNHKQLQLLKNWKGELTMLPNFKLKRYTESFLQSEKRKIL
ncbi:hypothetical protein WA026_014436 [Henosepilachna vigintioctopunctata]|uniref:Translation machinery-associated protein 16 n=1 Tax=Henosepilachna vigintioctopunctata TaxID=420089 RepID=A0AAW1UEL1_9CUCU